MKKAYSLEFILTIKYAWVLNQGQQAPQYFFLIIRIGIHTCRKMIIFQQNKRNIQTIDQFAFSCPHMPNSHDSLACYATCVIACRVKGLMMKDENRLTFIIADTYLVEELSNINVKCVKYRSRSLGQGTCQARAMG